MNTLSRRVLRTLILLTMTLLLPAGAAAAPGEMQESVLTYADEASNVARFKVHALPANGIVKLAVEFAPIPNGAPLSAEPLPTPAAVGFDLKYDGAALGFNFTAGDATTAFTRSFTVTGVPQTTGTPLNVAVDLDVEKPKGFPRNPPPAPPTFGRYQLTLSFTGGTGTGMPAEWTLAITGVPAGRQVLVSLSGAATFTKLDVANPPPAPSTCPSGNTCCPGSLTCHLCPLCKFCPPIARICEYVLIEWVPFPRPGPPCLQCPIPWKVPFREGFDRVLVAFDPRDREGKPINADQIDQIKVNVQGGQLIGTLVDQGEGRYVQMVEYPSGEPPRVSATAMGVTTKEFLAGSPPPPALRTYRTLTFLLAAALVIALGGGAAWLRRLGGLGRRA
jgi:hypothetical protein